VHVEDLAPYGPLPPVDERLKAIGWLERGFAYATGRSDPRVVDRLFDFVQAPWFPRFGSMGYHSCDLCPDAVPKSATVVVWRRHWLARKRRAEVGAINLYVAGSHCFYIAPSMILHYMLTHHYAPPPEFAHAVLSCPGMETPQYLQAIRDTGLGYLESTE